LAFYSYFLVEDGLMREACDNNSMKKQAIFVRLQRYSSNTIAQQITTLLKKYSEEPHKKNNQSRGVRVAGINKLLADAEISEREYHSAAGLTIGNSTEHYRRPTPIAMMKTANVLEGGKAIDPSCALWAVRMNLFFKSAISIPITYFFKQSCKIDLIRVAILFFQYEVELLTDNTSMSSTSDKTSIISASGGISMQFVSLTAS